MNTTEQPALPLDASTTVELVLTNEQVQLFSGLASLQQLHRGSVTFFVLASSYMPELRRGVLRLQGKLVNKRDAMRALKILRQADPKPLADPAAIPCQRPPLKSITVNPSRT